MRAEASISVAIGARVAGVPARMSGRRRRARAVAWAIVRAQYARAVVITELDDPIAASILIAVGLELGGRLTYLVDEGAGIRMSSAIRASSCTRG